MIFYDVASDQLDTLKDDYLATIRVSYKLTRERRAWCKSTKQLLMQHKLLSKAEQKEF